MKYRVLHDAAIAQVLHDRTPLIMRAFSCLSGPAEVLPVAPRSGIDDGTFQLLITARNPRSTPIMVVIPTDGWGLQEGYAYSITDVATLEHRVVGLSFIDAVETTRFSAGESKTFLADFRIGAEDETGFRVRHGTYRFSGSFAGVPAPEMPVVTLGP